MNNITTRIRTIFVVSLLAATMVAGATTPGQPGRANRDAVGEGSSAAQAIMLSVLALENPELQDLATDELMYYAWNFASYSNRYELVLAIWAIEWTPEGVDIVLNLLANASNDYLWSLDDEAAWYNTWAYFHAMIIWAIHLDQDDLLQEWYAAMEELNECKPQDVEPFLKTIADAFTEALADDVLTLSEVADLIWQMEAVAEEVA